MKDSYDKEIYEGDFVDFKVVHNMSEAFYTARIRYNFYKNQEVIYNDEVGMFIFGEDEYCMADGILEIYVVGNKYELQK
jgi:hypothetical protein